MLTEKKHKVFRSILRVAKVYVQKVPFLAIFNGERGKKRKIEIFLANGRKICVMSIIII